MLFHNSARRVCFVSLGLLAAASFLAMSGCAAPTDAGGADDANESSATTTDQALTGLTCKASATDDNAQCVDSLTWSCVTYSTPRRTRSACQSLATEHCARTYSQAKAICDLDFSRVFRLRIDSGIHQETKVYPTDSGETVEGIFNFFPRRHTGADPNPIYRCNATPGTTYGWEKAVKDFPTRDANCEGKGAPISVLGYSLPRGVRGAQAVYRCVTSGTGDHFLSWYSNCEGQRSEGLLGYAVKG